MHKSCTRCHDGRAVLSPQVLHASWHASIRTYTIALWKNARGSTVWHSRARWSTGTPKTLDTTRPLLHIRGRLGRLPAEDLLQDVLELLLDNLEEPSLKRAELVVDENFVLEQEGQDVFLVEECRSLSLGKNQEEKEQGLELVVEGEPANQKLDRVLVCC